MSWAGPILRALALLAAIPATAPGSPPAAASQASMPGIVLDGDRSLGVARQPDGRIGAFDLSDGRILWNGDESFEPLLMAGGRLAVREDDASNPRHFRVTWLDPASGRRVGPASAWIDLPDWASVAPRPGRTFAAAANLSDGALVVRWQAQGWYSGGANPTPRVTDRERRFASGAAIVDPMSGSVEPFGESRELSGKAADAAGANRGHPFGIEPWTLGNRQYLVHVDDKGGRREIFLERRDAATGKGRERWLLGELNDQVVAAPDGRALVVFHPGREKGPACALWRTDEPGPLLEFDCRSAPISGTWLGRSVYLLLRTSGAGTPLRVIRALSVAGGITRFELPVHSPGPLPPPR